MDVDMDGAKKAVKEQIADPLGLDVAEAALGIHRIVNAHMVGIGEDLEARNIIIPLAGLATVLSAFGIVNSDIIRSYTTSLSLSLAPENMEKLEEQYKTLEEQGRKELVEDGFEEDEIEMERIGGIRYHLQLTEIDVNLSNDPLNEKGVADIIERFDTRYAELYGQNAGYKEAGRDIISQYVRAIARTPKVNLKASENGNPDSAEALKGERDAYFADMGFTPTKIYDGDKLPAGSKASGPAILEMLGTTVVVPPGYNAKFDGYKNIYLKKEDS
jgi:N-methylhydantoinase A